MSKPKQFQKIIAQIHKNVYSKKWECILNECKETSINSHLLQQNGVLDNVAKDGHLIEIRQTDIFSWTPNKPPITMKKIGKRKAFSLPLFCNHHDTNLFKSIETHPIILDDYKVQLLLSYRVVCAEIRKKEFNLEIHHRILNANTLNGLINTDDIKTFIKGTELGIKDLVRYNELFEKELQNRSNQFTFKIYKYPLIRIYGSAIFNPIDRLITDPEQVEPLNSVFIHIVPYNESLNVIVGYHNDLVTDWIKEYVNDWSDLEPELLEKKLTNLFASHIENWGLSPTILKNIKDETLNQFVKYFHDNALNYSPDQKIEFNIFENSNYGT